jgi:dimeric dUTPase (all-alpha-NTP-PPase superfamily)
MQDELNSLISGENWREIRKAEDFIIATTVECAELLNCFNWEWWRKRNEKTRDDILMELVDIYHFVVSYCLMIDNIDNLTAVKYYFPGVKNNRKVNIYNVNRYVTRLITYLSNDYNAVDIIQSLLYLTNSLNFEIKDVYKVYCAKHALNRFRLNHGYKEGKYDRNWAGRDDNEVVIEYIKGRDEVDSDSIYEYLETSYLAKIK